MDTSDYLETQVMTATPQHLHLMVVEGAIRFAKQAKVSLENKQYEESNLALSKSREFVGELISGLNEEQAPEMIATLKELFSYIFRLLAKADFEQDPQFIDDAIGLLEKHRQTWLELIQTLADSVTMETPQRSKTSEDEEYTPWEGTA